MTDKNQPVAYEPHPVTPQRKRELRAKGYKIIDEVFAPAGHRAPSPESAITSERGVVDDAQERAQLIAELQERGIEFDAEPPTDELRALTITPPSLAHPDGLDSLGAEQLHALAKERGVKVHHAAGAEKVRAALREAGEAAQ